MVELSRQSIPIPDEDFADEKEVFLLAAYEQDAQQRGRELGRN